VSKRPPDVSVLTANRLQDGIVVYLTVDGTWSERIDAARVAHSAEEVAALKEQGAHAAARNLVVEPYLAAVSEAGGRLLPARMRERVRVEGPSILGDVPGYTPSPRATPASTRAPTARGEGRGEGQGHTPSSEAVAAPHPSPLPASGERGLPPVEAA
jgi:hypothetical protein